MTRACLPAGEGSEEDEEEYMSSSGSGSSSSDDEGSGGEAAEQEPDSAAKQRALEEARAMLADKPRKKRRKNAWLEDEVIARDQLDTVCRPSSPMLRTVPEVHAWLQRAACPGGRACKLCQ